uniref:BTB domain-containing protein n=1 Tax=Setaria viridis TaxID=4556 RepID=A0A4U6TVS2_SETVI|nr:BTB/POZ and MATH domain-containing protein 2-like [Setaria viridis]TKW01837.1 hypothetical protein SEVIR_8G205350v2 [Setaria viridis]
MSSSAVFSGRAQSASSIVAAAVEGSHVLTIDGYSRTKGLGNGKFIKSVTFDVGGHRWFIAYYPDGYDSESSGWISFFLKSDSSYSTKVKARFGFSLLDHVGETVPSYKVGSVIYAFGSKNRSWGYDKFIKTKGLEESTYLKDDRFRVRCDVTVLKDEMEIRAENSSPFVTVPPSDVNTHLGHLLSSGVEANVTFQVGEETFAAHRLLLGARSSVFMAELFGPMKEKHTSHIKIDDMEPRVFKAMLHYIYTDSLPEMEKDGIFVMSQHLLVAADRYGLDRLKLICEDKLCNYVSTGTAATTLALAEQHGCKGLKEACFKFLRSPGNLKTIMDSDGFKHLTASCPSLLSELLANVAP